MNSKLRFPVSSVPLVTFETQIASFERAPGDIRNSDSRFQACPWRYSILRFPVASPGPALAPVALGTFVTGPTCSAFCCRSLDAPPVVVGLSTFRLLLQISLHFAFCSVLV